MAPVSAAIVEFTQLKSKHMREPAGKVHPCRRVTNCLQQCITAKDTRARFAAISVKLHEAMDLLEKAVGAVNAVQGGEIKHTVEENKVIVEHIEEAVRYLPVLTLYRGFCSE
jgi:hypothetical protein